MDAMKTFPTSKITKLIASKYDKKQIQNIVIKKIIHDHLEDMISDYSRRESLPNEYVKIAKQNNCLQILMKGFLKKT